MRLSPRAAPRPSAWRRAASAHRSWRRRALWARPRAGKPSISSPSRSARLRVGRNGAPEGIVKTRGARWAMRPFMRRVREGKRLSFSLGLQRAVAAVPMRSRRPGCRIAVDPERSAKGRVRIPAASSRSKRGRASVCAARRKSRVPPMMRQPFAVEEGVEPRRFLAETRAHCFRPIQIGERAGPDRDRRPADRPRPRAGAQRLRRCRARRSRSRGEGRPGHRTCRTSAARPRESRAETARGSARAVEVHEGFVDDQRRRCARASRHADRAGRRGSSIRPSGLFGLTTIATSKSRKSSSRFARRRVAPAAREALPSSRRRSGRARRPRRAARCRASAWISACVPGARDHDLGRRAVATGGGGLERGERLRAPAGATRLRARDRAADRRAD